MAGLPVNTDFRLCHPPPPITGAAAVSVDDDIFFHIRKHVLADWRCCLHILFYVLHMAQGSPYLQPGAHGIACWLSLVILVHVYLSALLNHGAPRVSDKGRGFLFCSKLFDSGNKKMVNLCPAFVPGQEGPGLTT